MSEKILNIAGGKFSPFIGIESRPSFLVNVDTMYYEHVEPVAVERALKEWSGGKNVEYNINTDVFEFMERTIIKFNRVAIYRFLEHVSFTQVLYFVYLLSTVTEPGAVVDIIVPNYETLAKMILGETPLDGRFEEKNILLTTELLNEPSCPHASIWTPARAEHFWELEGRFKVKIDSESYKFDGRDIYLRFFATRI